METTKTNPNIINPIGEEYSNKLDKIFNFDKRNTRKPGKTYLRENPNTGKKEWMTEEEMMALNPPKHRQHKRPDFLCDFVTDDITGKPLHIKGRRHLNRVLKENGMMERPPGGYKVRGGPMGQGI